MEGVSPPLPAWPMSEAFGTPGMSSNFSSRNDLLQLSSSGPKFAAGQPIPNRPSADSLASLLDRHVVLGDSASSTHVSLSGKDGQEYVESADTSALNQLLRSIDSERDSGGQSSGIDESATNNVAARLATQVRTSYDEDIFSSIGGLDLGHELSELDAGQGSGSVAGKHTIVEQPSRTLFVRNVGPEVADDEIQTLFQAHGDISMLYTACKHRGFVIIGYYDLRAAARAAKFLQGARLHGQSLEIHFASSKGKEQDNGVPQGTVTVFNLDPDTTNEQLVWIFSKFGDVKDICQSPTRQNQKFIEFYDMRHAANALHAMNKAELSLRPAGVPTGGNAQNALLQAGVPQQEQLKLSASQQQLQYAASQQSKQREGPQLHGGHLEAPRGMSPPGLGPLSQQWDPALTDQLYSLLSQQGNLSQQQQQQQHSQQMAQAALQQAMESSGVHPGTLLDMANNISGLQRSSLSSESLTKLANAAQLLNARDGSAMHVSDSASSIASVSTPMQHPSLIYQSASSAAMNGLGSELQSQLAAQEQASQLVRMYGSSDKLHAMEQLLAQQGQTSDGRMMSNSLSYGSGLNMHPDQAAANLLLDYQMAGGDRLYSPELRSLSNPGLAASAAAAAAAASQQNAVAAAQGLWSGAPNAYQHQVAAAAAANAVAGMNMQELNARQQQQQLALNLSQIQANLQAQGLGGSVNAAALLQAAQNAQLTGGLMPRSMSTANAAQLLQAHALGNMAGLQAYGGMGLGGLGPKSASTNSLLSMGQMANRQRGDLTRGNGGRLSRRPVDSVAEAERRHQQEKLFALDMDRIRNGEDKRTTLMVKNIPNKYTQKMLLQTVDEHFKGTYDFFYLPIDFKNKCNVGYAFVNLTHPFHIIPLVERFNNKKWEKFNSEKVCHITYARIQGRSALISHFQNSSLMHEDKRCRPVLLKIEGPEAGEQEPFPVGPNVRPRATHLAPSAKMLPGHR